jgi:hypothetical protein
MTPLVSLHAIAFADRPPPTCLSSCLCSGHPESKTPSATMTSQNTTTQRKDEAAATGVIPGLSEEVSMTSLLATCTITLLAPASSACPKPATMDLSENDSFSPLNSSCSHKASISARSQQSEDVFSRLGCLSSSSSCSEEDEEDEAERAVLAHFQCAGPFPAGRPFMGPWTPNTSESGAHPDAFSQQQAAASCPWQLDPAEATACSEEQALAHVQATTCSGGHAPAAHCCAGAFPAPSPPLSADKSSPSEHSAAYTGCQRALGALQGWVAELQAEQQRLQRELARQQVLLAEPGASCRRRWRMCPCNRWIRV